MDQKDQQNNLKTLTQFTKSLFLKKITQLLLSVSLFSLILTNFSRLSFLHPFNSHFSTFPIQLFSHTLDKNYIFLLCNGLLVFVAKFSGLISSSRNNNYHGGLGYFYKNYEDESKVSFLDKEENIELKEQLVLEQEEIDHNEEDIVKYEEEEEEREFINVGEERKESEVVLFDEEEDQEEMIEFDNNNETPSQEEEEEEEEGNGVLSTEELNKRFDEFIRKMKEELRIEAQHAQQVILVK